MASEEVLRELVARISISKQACVVETPAEFIHHAIRLIRDIEELRFDQRYGRLNHRAISERVGVRIVLVFELELSFENQSFRIGKIELCDGNHFARALAYGNIERVFARIA